MGTTIVKVDDDSIDYQLSDIIEYSPEEEISKETDPYSFDKVAIIVPILKCKKCNFVNGSFEIILQHFKTHEKIKGTQETSRQKVEFDEVLICGICFAQYRSEETLKDHMIVDHHCVPAPRKDGSKSFDDPKSATSEDNDDSDTIPQSSIRPLPFHEFKMMLKRSLTYKCPMKGCCYKFDTKEKLESHVKCHVSSDPEKNHDFKCIKCGKDIKLWRNCTDHMWREHKLDIDMLGCPICTYKSHISVRIWRHMKSHPKWKSKVLRQSNWSPNKERSNITANRWYSQKTCQICSRQFCNSKTLSKHVKTVHNKIKPFICNVCERKSARKSTWIIHMRQHTGEKPLQCQICSYRASDPSVLKTHEKRHTKEAQYKCNACNYTSIQSSAFKFHVKSNHPVEFKNLSCDQCSYVSVSKRMLEAHKKDHKKGLILNEDSMEPPNVSLNKSVPKHKMHEKALPNVEISSDCFLPLESTDSIAPDPSIDTGGVTIPAHSEDTQFPNFIDTG